MVALYTHGVSCDNAQAHPGTPRHTPRHAQAEPGTPRQRQAAPGTRPGTGTGTRPGSPGQALGSLGRHPGSPGAPMHAQAHAQAACKMSAMGPKFVAMRTRPNARWLALEPTHARFVLLVHEHACLWVLSAGGVRDGCRFSCLFPSLLQNEQTRTRSRSRPPSAQLTSFAPALVII
jgi:hypothetical protein